MVYNLIDFAETLVTYGLTAIGILTIYGLCRKPGLEKQMNDPRRRGGRIERVGGGPVTPPEAVSYIPDIPTLIEQKLKAVEELRSSSAKQIIEEMTEVFGTEPTYSEDIPEAALGAALEMVEKVELPDDLLEMKTIEFDCYTIDEAQMLVVEQEEQRKMLVDVQVVEPPQPINCYEYIEEKLTELGVPVEDLKIGKKTTATKTKARTKKTTVTATVKPTVTELRQQVKELAASKNIKVACSKWTKKQCEQFIKENA